MDRKHERDALHGPWPIRLEELSAHYADRWIIYRELRSDGTHGNWIAEPRQPAGNEPGRISAGDIDTLATELAAAE